MTTVNEDPRYPSCSEQGKAELEVYLGWIQSANLADTEYAFVTYVMGRAQLKDPRHLFAIWLHQMGQQVDLPVKAQIRRFFMNPSSTVPFNNPQSAGWFDFIPWVYQLATEVAAPIVIPPTFVKVGSSQLPS
jgi:hypothetical protein